MFLAFKVCHEVIDGASVDNKDRRNELFGISGVRGNYPQVFAVGKDESKIVPVGQIEAIEELADNQKSNNTPNIHSTFTFAVEGFKGATASSSSTSTSCRTRTSSCSTSSCSTSSCSTSCVW